MDKRKAINGDYLIRIKGSQIVDRNLDTIELSTVGSFTSDGDHSRITYEETETTGFPGCTTTIEIDRNHCVSVVRRGPSSSHLVIEKNKRHLCHYETMYGNVMIGVSCSLIENNLKDNGGKLSFAYKLDVNSNHFSANRMDITVKKNGEGRYDN